MNSMEMITNRNYIAEEYYKADFYIKDKKFKRMCGDKSTWELNRELLAQNGIEYDDAVQDTRVASRFMFVEVS